MSARSIFVAAGLAVGTVVGIPAAVAAEDYVGKTPPEVEGTSFTRPPQVQGVTAARDPGESGGLPITGGDVAGLAVAGLGAIGVGAALVRRGRTRSVTA